MMAQLANGYSKAIILLWLTAYSKILAGFTHLLGKRIGRWGTVKMESCWDATKKYSVCLMTILMDYWQLWSCSGLLLGITSCLKLYFSMVTQLDNNGYEGEKRVIFWGMILLFYFYILKLAVISFIMPHQNRTGTS